MSGTPPISRGLAGGVGSNIRFILLKFNTEYQKSKTLKKKTEKFEVSNEFKNRENCDFAEKKKAIEFCAIYCSVRLLNSVLV